jgi:hypothetical protein
VIGGSVFWHCFPRKLDGVLKGSLTLKVFSANKFESSQQSEENRKKDEA